MCPKCIVLDHVREERKFEGLFLVERAWKVTFRFLLGKLIEFKILTELEVAQAALHAGAFPLRQRLSSACTYAPLSFLPFCFSFFSLFAIPLLNPQSYF